MTIDDLIAALQAATQVHMNRYLNAGIVPQEWTFETWEGETWIFDSCNDLGVPYFHRPSRKTLFTVPAAASELYDHAKATEYNND